jgi:hypothetical protein
MVFWYGLNCVSYLLSCVLHLLYICWGTLHEILQTGSLEVQIQGRLHLSMHYLHPHVLFPSVGKIASSDDALYQLRYIMLAHSNSEHSIYEDLEEGMCIW